TCLLNGFFYGRRGQPVDLDAKRFALRISVNEKSHQPAKFAANCAANLLSDDVFLELASPERYGLGIAEPSFFQHSHRGNVLWHHQADDSFKAEIGET